MVGSKKKRFICPACGVPKRFNIPQQRLVRLKAEAMALTEQRNFKMKRLYAVLDEIDKLEGEIEELKRQKTKITAGVYDELRKKLT